MSVDRKDSYKGIGSLADFELVTELFTSAHLRNVAFIRAWKADTAGNLHYRMTEQNFNKAMATAADLVIVEVQEIVPVGSIAPEDIHTPGCFVDYLVKAELTTEDLGSPASVSSGRDHFG